jgi:O-antigen/teichoic acid export membrane protein
MTSPVAYLRTNWPLLSNTATLMLARIIAALSGLIYWALATNRLNTDSVSFATTAQASIYTIASIGILGLGSYLATQIALPKTDRLRAMSSSAVTVLSASIAAGALFGALAPFLVNSLNTTDCRACTVSVFAIGAGISGVSLLIDELATSQLLGGLAALRAVAFAVLRTAILWIMFDGFGWRNPLLPAIAWALGEGLSALVIIPALARRGLGFAAAKIDTGWVRAGIGQSLSHHALTFASSISGYFLPIIIGAVLATFDNAMFGAAWVNISPAFVIPFTLSSVLFASVLRDPTLLASKLRQVLVLGLLGCIAAAGIVWVIAPFLTARLGPDYAGPATQVMRALSLVLIPVLLKGLWTTVHRLQGTMTRALRPLLLGGILELGLPALGGALYGLNGATYGWLASQFILGAVYALPLYRIARG